MLFYISIGYRSKLVNIKFSKTPKLLHVVKTYRNSSAYTESKVIDNFFNSIASFKIVINCEIFQFLFAEVAAYVMHFIGFYNPSHSDTIPMNSCSSFYSHVLYEQFLTTLQRIDYSCKGRLFLTVSRPKVVHQSEKVFI